MGSGTGSLARDADGAEHAGYEGGTVAADALAVFQDGIQVEAVGAVTAVGVI